MTVTVRLFGDLKAYAPAGQPARRACVDLPEGTSARQLVLRLGIPYGGEEGPLVIAVNDVEVDHGATLRAGDTISLFEPLAGG